MNIIHAAVHSTFQPVAKVTKEVIVKERCHYSDLMNVCSSIPKKMRARICFNFVEKKLQKTFFIALIKNRVYRPQLTPSPRRLPLPVLFFVSLLQCSL